MSSEWEPTAEQVEQWARAARREFYGGSDGWPEPPGPDTTWSKVACAVAVEVARELRGALERARAQAAADQATAERWMNALGLMTRERDALLAEVVALRKGLQARPTPAGEEGAG